MTLKERPPELVQRVADSRGMIDDPASVLLSGNSRRSLAIRALQLRLVFGRDAICTRHSIARHKQPRASIGEGLNALIAKSGRFGKRLLRRNGGQLALRLLNVGLQTLSLVQQL